MAVNGLALVTPTGDRPAGFALVERWMARQGYSGEVQWIVVDDGRVPTAVTAGQEYVRRERAGDTVRQTLCLNLRAALPLVRYEHLVVVEDDDWYPASYLDDIAGLLDGPYDMVGIGRTKNITWPSSAGSWTRTPSMRACSPRGSTPVASTP
jgi:hypothetical protein